MKPGEINIQNYTDFIKNAKERFDPKKAKARTSFEAGSGFIKKFKMEPDTTYTVLVPLELCLPFDPTTLSTDEFNTNNPLPLPGSPTTAVRTLKTMAKNNPDFANKLAEVLGATVADLKLDVDAIDKAEIKLWHKLCRIQYITGYVQHMNTKKDKFPFGRNVGADAILNDDGDVTDTKGIGYRLYEMESAILSIEVQRIRDSYEPGGINADRTAKDMETAISNLWKERLIGNPYQIAFCRVFVFASNKDGEVNKTDIDQWNKTKKVQQFMRYQKILRDRIGTFEAVLMSKSDINMDFIETIVEVPKAGDNDKINYQNINYSTANRASSIFQLDEDTNQPVNDLEGFKDEFIKFRDDDKLWSDDILKKSIIEYRIPSDTTLLAEMSNSLQPYEEAMKSPKLFQEYSDVINMINSNLHAAIAEKLLDGEDNGKDISQDIIDAAPLMDENNAPTDEFNAELELKALLDDDDDDGTDL